MEVKESRINILIFLCFTVGLVLGIISGIDSMEDEAIKKGHAEYNQTNGQWQWRE